MRTVVLFDERDHAARSIGFHRDTLDARPLGSARRFGYAGRRGDGRVMPHLLVSALCFYSPQRFECACGRGSDSRILLAAIVEELVGEGGARARQVSRLLARCIAAFSGERMGPRASVEA